MFVCGLEIWYNLSKRSDSRETIEKSAGTDHGAFKNLLYRRQTAVERMA